MVTVSSRYFDLSKIADSGQCFRIYPSRAGGYVTVSQGRVVHALQEPDGSWTFDCSLQEFDSYWNQYFDMGTNYQQMLDSVDVHDGYLREAAKVGCGLRVVNQDPWETLVSFIVSQRRSVSSITTCIRKLCRAFGDKIEDRDDIYTFPTPERLASLSGAELEVCSAGYRTAYILDAARKVASGELDLQLLSYVDDQTLLDTLMTIHGVGIKVACCTALYGYHRLGLFPVDVWVQRVLDAHYPQGFPAQQYPGYAGFLQLLMFYEARH